LLFCMSAAVIRLVLPMRINSLGFPYPEVAARRSSFWIYQLAEVLFTYRLPHSKLAELPLLLCYRRLLLFWQHWYGWLKTCCPEAWSPRQQVCLSPLL
jgi:hypothetical protein